MFLEIIFIVALVSDPSKHMILDLSNDSCTTRCYESFHEPPAEVLQLADMKSLLRGPSPDRYIPGIPPKGDHA